MSPSVDSTLTSTRGAEFRSQLSNLVSLSSWDLSIYLFVYLSRVKKEKYEISIISISSKYFIVQVMHN